MPVAPEVEDYADAQYTYTFTGWDSDIVAVTGTTIYTAQFEQTLNEYKITWYNEDGVTVLKEKMVAYGEVPTCDKPSKEGDVQFSYVFAGWSPEVVAVEGEASYTAVFDQVVNKYAVTWVNHNGETIVDDVAYGTVPTAPTFAYKEYTFLGWDKEVVAVEGEVTYTAIYDIDGIDEGYYYVDGILQSENAQLIKIGEDLYYVQHSGAIKKNGNQTISKIRTNGYVEAGTYYFNAEGIMRNPADDLKGEIGADGYYYVKGEVRQNVGLVEVEGDWYYVQYSGLVKKAGNQTIAADKLNAYTGEAGTYYFFEDGTMQNPLDDFSGYVQDGYYLVKGRVRKNVGLVQLEDGFYFVCYSGKVKTGFQTITEKNCNGFEGAIGIQRFDADGRLIQ